MRQENDGVRRKLERAGKPVKDFAERPNFAPLTWEFRALRVSRQTLISVARKGSRI